MTAPFVVRGDAWSDEWSQPPIDLAGRRYNRGSISGGGNRGGWGGYETGVDYSFVSDYSYTPPPIGLCEQDAFEDMLAMSVAELIKQQPDWNAREYGAVIIRYAEGYYGLGPLTRGETVQEAIARGADAPSTRISTGGAIPPGAIIVGLIHSHPDVGYNDQQDIDNRYPSSYDGGGDYNNIIGLINNHDARFPSSTVDFTHYILGPDGALREFNLGGGLLNPQNDPSPNSRSDLMSDRPCG